MIGIEGNAVLPRFWCRRCLQSSTRRLWASCRGKDTTPEEIIFGTTIHGPLQQLEPVDLTLDGTGAPRFDEAGQHRIMIALAPAHERIEQGSFCIGQPSLERRSVSLVRRVADKGREAGCQFACTPKLGRYRDQVTHECAL